MRVLFAIIGYACVATVLSMAIGVAYLWRTDRLSDEKVFRVVALMHGVDLQEIAATQAKKGADTPAQETSLAEIERLRQVADRNFEVKQDALQRGRQEFEHRLRRLSDATERFDRMAKDLESRLQEQGELSTKESVKKVVRDIESVKEDVGKELLLRFMEDGKDEGIRDVIMLMNSMSTNSLKKILKRFQSEADLEKLHTIHQMMLEGGQQKDFLEQALEQIRSRDLAEP